MTWLDSLLLQPGPQGPTGPTGSTGPTGPAGSSGINAFTTTTSNFTQPSVGSNVTVAVVATAWMSQGQTVYASTGGYYAVASIASGVSVTITNLGYTGNALPGATISSGATISAAGQQGATGWTVGYNVNFASLTTQNLISGGDGPKTLSDGSIWTATGTGNTSTFGITNGTGLVITKNSTSDVFSYFNAYLTNLVSGINPYEQDVEIWCRATTSGLTTANSGSQFAFEMRDNSSTNPASGAYANQRMAISILSTSSSTPTKEVFVVQNNGSGGSVNAINVDSPTHDVFMARARGPALWDAYTGTFGSAFPAEDTLSHEASVHWVSSPSGSYYTTFTASVLKGANLGLQMLIGSTTVATPSVTITNLMVRYK